MKKPNLFKRISIYAIAFMAISPFTQAQELTNEQLMDMDFEELMKIPIVIASKKSESNFVAPLSTTVLSREEIERSGVTSIEEAFRLVPGIIVRQRTNGNFDVQIRGNDNIPPQNMTMYSENTTTLIMINGRKVFNYANGGILWETLPISLNDIQRIEIIRGPSTAMYGPNALSGVINIVTSDVADEDITVTGNVQAGSLNTQIYNAAVSSSQLNDKLKVRVAGNFETFGRSTSNHYSYGKGTYVPFPQFYEYDGSPSEAEYGTRHFPNNDLSKERKGFTGAIEYKMNKEMNFVLEAGHQESNAQTVFIETQNTPLTTRLSNTSFVNAIAKIHGLEINVANSFGDQNLEVGNDAAEVKLNQIDASAEYNWQIGTLTIRPGISWQKAIYSDLDYAGATKTGFFNASRNIETAAGYLRGDYQATDKLRLIGALRADKYNVPATTAITYQLVATYSINESNFVRASYGTANKGPVIMDNYADYHAGGVVYKGNQNLDLTLNTTTEIGYRWMALKNLSFDAEMYYSITKNPTVFEYDEALSASSFPLVTMSYHNLDLESHILGGALSVNYVVSSKYQAKAWVGYSDNQLKNFDEKTLPFLPQMGVFPTTERKNITNPQTPKWYGGASLSTTPIDKLTANLDCYFMSPQEYIHESDAYAKLFSQMIPGYTGKGRTDLDGRVIVNVKVGYDIYKKNQLFFNCRNLLNNNTPEAGFIDPVGAMYLVGLKIDL